LYAVFHFQKLTHMEKFTGEHGKCISQEEGLDVMLNGVLEGTGGHVKDCFWAGYRYKGECFISLNNYPGSFWRVPEEDMILYCMED